MKTPFRDHYESFAISNSYDEIVAKRNTYLSPSLKTFQAYNEPLVMEKGMGQWIWDVEGRRYLDLMAQNTCISAGYRHPLVESEVHRQMDRIQHVTTTYFNAAPAHLAEELASRLPQGNDWTLHFVNSGAEAVDLALLMARLHTGAHDILALRNSYHGLHFACMSLTGIQGARHAVPSAPGIIHVNSPSPYRGLFGEDTAMYIEDFDQAVMASTPGRIAGFIVEPIQGYGGVSPMPEGYLPEVFERTREAGGLCIIDEVQTAFGRLGSHYWGFEWLGATPDIVVMGKGLGNGHPLSAVAVKRQIAESMSNAKFFNTYACNPISCAAGRAVLRAVDVDGLMENSNAVGLRMKERLSELMEKHDVIGDVRGRGLLLGMELVRDRTAKIPAAEEAGRLMEFAKEKGLIIGKCGQYGNVIKINPPMCIRMEDVDLVIEVLDRGLARF
jgi:alanine-glyoxylate transaminase/(R)-3-amino-2-methylpropionate-pyruvate transaminase